MIQCKIKFHRKINVWNKLQGLACTKKLRIYFLLIVCLHVVDIHVTRKEIERLSGTRITIAHEILRRTEAQNRKHVAELHERRRKKHWLDAWRRIASATAPVSPKRASIRRPSHASKCLAKDECYLETRNCWIAMLWSNALWTIRAPRTNVSNEPEFHNDKSIWSKEMQETNFYEFLQFLLH